MLKVKIHNPEDAFYHLKESERLLRDVKVDQGVGVTEAIFSAAIQRNQELFTKANLERERK